VRPASRFPVTSASRLVLVALVILIASLQVTARSEDPNAVALSLTESLLTRTSNDLAQYRPLSYVIAVGLQRVTGTGTPPYEQMRFGQCLLIFGLAYVFYSRLGLQYRTRLVGLGLLAGLMSLNLGPLGPSTFSLDRFTDTIFFLVAGLLVLRGLEVVIPALMVLAVANRETSVFIPMFIVARHWLTMLTDRRPLIIALAAWTVAAIMYLAVHAYYGPRPRVEHSYFGPDMFLHSLSMPAQVAWFVAALNLLPLLSLLSLKAADPALRRVFWLVVPAWLVIHIWAARLGEGIMYLAPITTILVPMVLQGIERPSALGAWRWAGLGEKALQPDERNRHEQHGRGSQ
jgi:hypothetical protein